MGLAQNANRVHHLRVAPIHDAIEGALTGALPKSWHLALADTPEEGMANFMNQAERLAREKADREKKKGA